MNERVLLHCWFRAAVLLLLGLLGGFLHTRLVGWRHQRAPQQHSFFTLCFVTVGYLRTELATASFVQHGRIFIRFWRRGRRLWVRWTSLPFEPEYTDEELLERRMQTQREEQLAREQQTAARPQIDASWWCCCGRCLPMPTEEECLCLWKYANTNHVTSSYQQ